MNTLFLVGRLTKNPVLKKAEGKNSCYITLAVKRPYKNSEGIYESDFINCTVWNVVAERVCEFCRKGDIISVKARVQNNNYTDKDDNKVYSYEFIADQITFVQGQKYITEEELKEDAEERAREEELIEAE